MHIVMLGCSFGVPNYRGFGDGPEGHLQFLLQSSGHRVRNISKNNASNLQCMNLLQRYLSSQTVAMPVPWGESIRRFENETVDYIIWFHTQILRDYFYFDSYLPVEAAYSQLVHITYKKFFEISSQTNAKIIIIGGAGKVHPSISDYGKIHWCLPSMIESITSTQIPLIDGVNRPDVLEKCPDPTHKKLEFLKKFQTVVDVLDKHSNWFPNGHPGKSAHQWLFKNLTTHFARP